MRLREMTTLYVNFEQVMEFSEDLAEMIEKHYYRVDPYLRQAVREFVVARHPDYETDDKEQRREFHIAFHSLPSTQR